MLKNKNPDVIKSTMTSLTNNQQQQQQTGNKTNHKIDCKSLKKPTNTVKGVTTTGYKQSSLYGSNNSLVEAVYANIQKRKQTPSRVRIKEPLTNSTPKEPNKQRTISTLRKVGAKVGAVMRRASSRDSLDSNREREKENLAKPASTTIVSRSNKTTSGGGVAGITIMQLEKDKTSMELQISELVRNAESKKAEIATLKIEIKRLKEKPYDDERDQVRQELESFRNENRTLKERLLDLGIPLEQTSLSDSEKEQLLLRRSASGSMASLDSERKDPTCLACRKSEGTTPEQDPEVGEASGISLPPAGGMVEWDKASSSSQSEVSVACLQDRIMQMEETHYSTNEELQATLQELTDLQDQLTDLQMDNDRMGEDKAVLLESLCSQTEKLEECRAQLTQLKQLLFQQFDEGSERCLGASERERHYVELLKNAQDEHDSLVSKYSDINVTLSSMKEESHATHSEYDSLLEKVRFHESAANCLQKDKRLLEGRLLEAEEQISAHQIDSTQLRLQLEKEQQKVLELHKERDANATSELETLLQETRQDKEKVEEHALHLQEQLSLAQREVTRVKEQLSLLQDENKVCKNNARKQISDLEYHVEQLTTEKISVHKQTEMLSEQFQEAELKCQRHLEDKRELKANVGELQKGLQEKINVIHELNKELKETKEKLTNDTEEWRKFQADLLTTVRVANDFKTEAQVELERLLIENKQLREKLDSLESEMEKMSKDASNNSPTHNNQRSSAMMRNSNSPFGSCGSSETSVLSTVEKELASARRPLGVANNKLADYRGASQLSVKSLIESIENATKVKGLSSSRSSSTSSISSLASETRTNSILMRTTSTESAVGLREAKSNSVQSVRLQRGSSISEAGAAYANKAVNDTCSKTNNAENDKMNHPVSILSNKLEPIRRNSYGYLDVVEKKDPLSSLVKGGGSKRNALLKWCQNKTLGYKAIDITNFSSSWNDGLAFCALLHSYLPDLIPYDELDSKDKSRNFTLAFQAAESVGIATTLLTKDLISQERPDWQSIMSYVTSLYKHFET